MRFFSYLNYLAGQTSNSDESKSNDQNVDWSEIPKDTANEEDQTRFDEFAVETFINFSKVNKDFDNTTKVLHPNLMRYFIKNGACKIIEEKDNLFLVCSFDKTIKTKINKQIKFGFEFSSVLRNKKNKIEDENAFNYLSVFFDEDDNILMTCTLIDTFDIEGLNEIFGNEINRIIDFKLDPKIQSSYEKNKLIKVNFFEDNRDWDSSLNTSRFRCGNFDDFYSKVAHIKKNPNNVFGSDFFGTPIQDYGEDTMMLAVAWESLWYSNGYKDYFMDEFIAARKVSTKEIRKISYLESRSKILMSKLSHFGYDLVKQILLSLDRNIKYDNLIPYDLMIKKTGVKEEYFDKIKEDLIGQCRVIKKSMEKKKLGKAKKEIEDESSSDSEEEDDPFEPVEHKCKLLFCKSPGEAEEELSRLKAKEAKKKADKKENKKAVKRIEQAIKSIQLIEGEYFLSLLGLQMLLTNLENIPNKGFDDMNRYHIFKDLIHTDLPRVCVETFKDCLKQYKKYFVFSTALGLDDKEIDKSCYNHNESEISCHKEIVFDFEVS